MGLLANALSRLVREDKLAVGAAIPTWDSGVPKVAEIAGQGGYVRYAREGYSGNDLVYACIEELATSAAEPRLACYQTQADGTKDKLAQHPLYALFEAPNPFMDRFSFLAASIMYLSISGNAFIAKERSAAGKLTEFWHLRPDRVRIIPDARTHIRGYEYRIGDYVTVLPPADVIHLRYRNPQDDYYGLPPLAVVARRVDIDNAMREFTRAFFVNAGIPAGLLSIQKQVSEAERQLIRTRFRQEYGGQGAHNLLVLDSTEASYTPMGLPLGGRGLAMPELDEISEVRIARPFGVPLELISARLSMRGQRSAAKEARAGFWDETLVPLYKLLAAQLYSGLKDEPLYGGYDCLEFDLEGVQALQEDADAKHKRVREDMLAGVVTREEARQCLGYPETLPTDGYWVLAANEQVVPVGQEVPPEPEPAAGADAEPAPLALTGGARNGHTNGRAR